MLLPGLENTRGQNCARCHLKILVLLTKARPLAYDCVLYRTALKFEVSMRAFIEWTDEISVGIQEIDEQHKILINLINDLYEVMIAGRNQDKEVERIVGELAEYTRVHFAVEESLFRIFSYADYERHKKMHEELASQVMDIDEKIKSGEKRISSELLFFLKRWITQHILSQDKKYAPFLIEQGVKKSWKETGWLKKIWK